MPRKVQIDKPRMLLAKQVFTYHLDDGQEVIGMVEDSGVIYTFTKQGWVRCNMEEAPHDDTEV